MEYRNRNHLYLLKRKTMKKLLSVLTIIVSLSACKSNNADEAIGAAKQSTIDSMNTINTVKQATIDSVNQAKARDAQRRAEVARSSSNSSSSTTTTNNTTTTTTEQKKKGWSSTAKGAVIGAGTGAVAGGIIGKNAKGAVIGGLVGAGVGAGTGAIIDSKKKKQ
jgi:hypothetical protein